MRLREKTAWVLVVALSAALTTHAVAAHKTKREAGEMLTGCADALMEGQWLREQAAEIVYDRGNEILECTEQICRTNGWTPPFDWDEGPLGPEEPADD